jgi:HAMP domain-containing protein
MTDIVERLRNCSKYGAYQQGQPGRIMAEAADEIELLRETVKEQMREVATLRRALEPKP